MEIPVLKQSPVTFRSSDHTYWKGKKELKGITQTLIKRAYPDTYSKPDRYTEEEWQQVLDNAAAKGSVMHETIELYDELGIESDLPELKSYIRIIKENDLQVIATEYVVSDEKHYATAIDKVCMRRSDGAIILIDFKRTYELHTENVTLQQSICKRWFEKLNPGLKVAAIYVLWMRDEQSKFIELRPWADEALDYLKECDLKDEPFDINRLYGDLPVKFASAEDEIAKLELWIKEATERRDMLKEGLYNVMAKYDVKSWTGQRVRLTRTLPTTSEGVDTRRLKEEQPDIFNQYKKVSTRKGSLTITVLKNETQAIEHGTGPSPSV